MILTFDVETMGLYGEAFAVGYVVTDAKGKMLDEGLIVADYLLASGGLGVDRGIAMEWVRNEVIPHLPKPTVTDTRALRAAFAAVIRQKQAQAKECGEALLLAADVPFPCETTFLLEIYADWEGNRDVMPYPPIDIASVLLAHGYDPVGTYPRLASELPKHNPLNDARQSSRLLHTALNEGKARRVALGVAWNFIVDTPKDKYARDIALKVIKAATPNAIEEASSEQS